MTTCTWLLSRHARRVIAAAGIAALASGLFATRASADQISTLKAQAAALAARIETLGRQEDALAQQYDAAQLALQQAQERVSEAEQRLAGANAATKRARRALVQEAIQAYVHGGTSLFTDLGPSLKNATTDLLRAEYAQSLTADQTNAIDQYHLAALQDQAAKQQLQRQQAAAAGELAQLARDRQSVKAAQAELQAAYNQDQGRIATLVAEAQAAAAAAAERAAQARLAAEIAAQQAAQQAAQRAAQQAAQQAVQQAPATSTTTQPASPPPQLAVPSNGTLGERAVAAAETRLGDPYVWGAAGPNAFDCSGLVMWAYEQVGVSLPHFSGAQYADTTHIPMSDLQPGDLVFPSNPDQHVAIYIGNGEIIQAPYTGATVSIAPLTSWFTLASRVG